MKSINILKKTFILFCLAAIPLSTVQPMHAATSRKNRAKKSKRKKNSQNTNSTIIKLAIGVGTIVVVGGGATYLYTKKNEKKNKKEYPKENEPNENLISKEQEVLVINCNEHAYLFDLKNKCMLSYDKAEKIRLSPNEERILLVGADSQDFCIVDFMRGENIKTIKNNNDVGQIAWNPKNNEEFIASDEDGIRIINTDSPEKSIDIQSSIRSLCFSTFGGYIVTSTDNKEISIYENKTETKKILYKNKYNNLISNIQWHTQQPYIVMADNKGNVCISKVTIPSNENNKITLEEVTKTTLDKPVTSVSWSPDGRYLALTTKLNLYIAEWDASAHSLKIGESHHSGKSLSNVDWSSNNQELAFIDYDQIIIHSDPLNKRNQHKVSKYKIKHEDGNSLPLNYLAYGIVKDTSKWEATQLTEDD